ncbi:beta-lyase [Chryseobacterium sp. Leaf180]|uniref:aminotransferase class I/II-fold pyridoxal phosphate-dependent enzyme n=1 Tax=Chryseobacterium sp. Leaf180 TaxID=1736289 RepID=UPI0006FE9E8C|nr:aminotransferase class I/II-fold pyridoxal phosphate-dependent enzyme [Chryseobacterium sp. Leaf180]KQR94704.1 beta-lyase [Chryseobacterium sp. Leaf180]
MKNNGLFQDYTFFTEMSELAKQHGSYDLSLGLPDFPVDPRLKEFLRESVDHVSHGYESLAGNPFLIGQIISFNAKRENPIHLKENEVSVVPCSTFALYTSLKSILNPGDEVIIIQPAYYTYAPSVSLNGGVPVFYDLEDDFSIDFDKLKRSVNEKTRAVIVNSPHNPTGKIWRKEDWENLYHAIKDHDIYLISEEIYDIYCYGENRHYSPFLHPELKKRTFSIFSFGKMFHATGWKVSYLISSPELLENFRFYQQYISFSSNGPCQHAVAKYLAVFDENENRILMENKRNLFLDVMKETPLQTDHICEGAFFQTVNFREISKDKTDVEFAKWLTVEMKVSCLPLSAFIHSKQNSDYIRFSFAKRDELIYDALNHLRKNL